jgi:hypothetical protein
MKFAKTFTELTLIKRTAGNERKLFCLSGEVCITSTSIRPAQPCECGTQTQHILKHGAILNPRKNPKYTL